MEGLEGQSKSLHWMIRTYIHMRMWRGGKENKSKDEMCRGEPEIKHRELFIMGHVIGLQKWLQHSDNSEETNVYLRFRGIK